MIWYKVNGKNDNIVVSSRIRFARNIDGYKFVNQKDKKELEEILNLAKTKIETDKLKLYKLEDMDELTKISLVEKHLISQDILKNKLNESGILLSDDESVSIMINEEDHFRIQVINSGLELKNSLEFAKKIDEMIGKKIKYAYSEKYGYLTSCPTNVGTGMRASVMLYLPALAITGRVNKILDIINKMGLNVRGFYGEGSGSVGNMYQISNKVSLGVTEEEIVDNIENVVLKIIEQEENARKFLKKQGVDFEDRIFRSYAILMNARKLSSDECNKLISDVKLGIDLGIINDVERTKLNEILVLTKPATLQKYYGEILSPEERDVKRAELVKKVLGEK